MAAARYGIYPHHAAHKPTVSPESALAGDIFDQFCNAVTFKSILALHRRLCDVLRLRPTHIAHFYPKLKAKLKSWRAQALWTKFDKRANHRVYNRGKACTNTRVLIIGCGPCGLRAAIEAQLLGAKVVVVEKRDRFSRNNVLHLWPFLIHDLRALGAKKFFGKFCAGAIDHISIRQLQCILLKVALLLGVEVHENLGFEGLIPPPEDQSTRIGWRAQLSPANHPAAQYEFDALIGADGKRNTLQGFGRKEFRGKLAIAITANFVNRHTEAEARVQEISGVAFIFNQKFFKDLYAATGIDLENIVYYKDDTHYFVMTAKKQSLLAKGVIVQDFPDTQRLLAPDNVCKNALMDYAREAADFSTNYQLPTLDFAVNHYGQPDVAMFDFTSMFAAENASRVIERHGHRLLMQIVGDSLLEPFWPTGSGCARGFLSCFDACWSVLQWSKGTMTPLEVVAERESIYRLLAQTTPENLHKDFNGYSLEPYTRYPNLNMRAVLAFQVRSLYDTDDPDNVERACEELDYKRLKRAESVLEAGRLLAWLKEQVEDYPGVHVEDLTTSLKDGLALCAVIDRYRPDLLNFSALDPGDVAINNQLAFDILQDLGISMVMTGIEMAQCDIPDTLTMLAYLTQVYDLFRSEIPQIRQPVDHDMEEELIAVRAASKPAVTPSQRLSHLNKASRTLTRRSGGGSREGTLKGSDRRNSESLRRGRKRRSTDKTMSLERQAVQRELDENREERKQRFATAQRLQFQKSMTMLTAAYSRVGLPSEDSAEQPDSENGRAKQIEDMALFLYRLDSDFEDKKRRLEKMLFQSRIPDHGRSRPMFPEGRGGLEGKVKDLEEKLRANAPRSKPKDMIRAVGKLEKSDWNVQRLEKKREENEMCVTSEKEKSLEIKICKETFSDKYDAMNKRLHGLPTEVDAKYAGVDQSLKKLEKKLKEGSTLEVGQRGSNKVSAMAEQFATKLGKKEKANNDVMKSNFKPMLPLPPTGGSENCHFCQKRVYLMERMSAEGKFFHRTCFKCQYCAALLRLGSYSYVRDDLLGGLFLCMNHVNMQYHMRSELKRKLEEVDGPPTKMTLVTSAEELSISPAPPSTPPASPAITALQAMESEVRGGTPERVEFENSASAIFEKEDLVEIDEDEWTDRNFGPSATPTSDDDSSSDFSGEEDEYEEDEELEVAGELPMTAYETLQLAKDWHRKYSQDDVDESDDEKSVDGGSKSRRHRSKLEDVQENVGDIGTEDGIYLKVPRSRQTAASESDTEVATGSDDDEECEEEEDYDDEELEEEYDEEEEEEEESEDEENSATEIETDSEFDVDHIEIRQEIPTIVVEESGEQCNGSIESMPPAQPNPRPSAEPLPEYIEQRISLKDTALAGTQTGGYDSQRSASMSNLPQTSAPEDTATAKPQRPSLLANLRRHDLTSNSTSDIQAAKHAALRKQYLLGPSASAPAPQKSASVAQLDTKLKSLNDRISEAQKLLNPAPQPSPSMQVFLEKSSNLFQTITPVSSGPDIGKFVINADTVRNAETGPTTLFGTVLPKVYVPLDIKKTGQDASPLRANVTAVTTDKDTVQEPPANSPEAVVSAAVESTTGINPTSDSQCAGASDVIVEEFGVDEDLSLKFEGEKENVELKVSQDYMRVADQVKLEDKLEEVKEEEDGASQDDKSGRKSPLVETCINVPLLLASEAASGDKCDLKTEDSSGESSSDEEDSAQDGECHAESFNGDTSSSLGSDTESEFDRIYEASNDFVQLSIPYVEIEDTSCPTVPLTTPKAMETLPEIEEDLADESPAVDSSVKVPVTETPIVATIALKNIAVQEDFDLTPEEAPSTKVVEAIHPRVDPSIEPVKEIMPETSKPRVEETVIEQVEEALFTVCSIPRARSRESIDSARLLTETENSDWVDDLKEEFHINAEFITTRRSKEKDMKSTKKYEDKVNSEEKEKEKPVPALLAEMEDIDFADQSSTGSRKEMSAKNQPLERGYLPLQNDLSPEEPPKLVLEKKSTPFAKSRDSLAIHREKTPLYNPELTSSLKKYLPSPSVARKKEALSQERERQNDLIRDLVLARIPGPKRRGSRDSMSPPSSAHASRAGSEARTLSPKPPAESISKTPTPAAPLVRSSLPETPITHPQKFLARELFTPTKTDKTENVVEFKTPSIPPRVGEPKITTVEREQARQEARVKAQAKRDAELGLSPPDYITNLKDKLRRKASVTETETDSTPKATPSRARAFSEPQPVTVEQSAKQNTDQAASSQSLAPPTSLQASSTSALLTVDPIQIGEAFQREATSSPTGLSPPQSPRSTSSKSSSYLWAGLSPAESIEGQLDEESAKKPAKEAGKSTKKSKDPERRKSLIQMVAGIFKSSDKKEKEPQSPKNPKSPLKDKIPLLKSTPKKEKGTTPEPSQAATPTPKEDALRNRALSSPSALESASASSERDATKDTRGRAVSYTSSPTSSGLQHPGAVSTPRNTASPRGSSLRDLTPPSESSLLDSGHRLSKQAKQAARQAELKRLRMAQAIQRQLEELEVKQKALEEQGVKVEKALRGEEGGTGKDEATLMQEWFHLVHEKNALSRFEQELMVRARELELEDRHARLQQELKERMAIEESKKSPADIEREGALLSEMLEIVEQREALLAMLEEDKQRYREEDKDLEAQMLAKGLRLTSWRKESQV